MATKDDVLAMLLPNGGYMTVGDNYEGINFLECKPFTKAEFEAGFKQFDAWKAKQDAGKAEKKAAAQAKLAALGLTTDDLAALGL